MKRFSIAIVIVASIVLLAGTASPAISARAAPATITLLNPPPAGLLELAVGQSYTFDIEVTSDEPFILAVAMTDQYYPGRGIRWHGGDRATHSTDAVLHLTVTGKKPTAGLPAVCDWPEPGVCWPEGVAPASIVAGVRYKGGQVVAEQFAFAVLVP